MASSEVGSVENVLSRVLAPTFVVSGAAVLSGFFFPALVGETVTGRGWLAVSLLFFGSGLGYLALLPYGSESGADAAAYLLRIRRARLASLLREFVRRQDAVVVGAPALGFAVFFGLHAAAPSATARTVAAAADATLAVGGPLFAAAVVLGVAYCAVLLLGPWGEIRLGGPDAEPTYTYPTYFSLVFTAGIAAGIVFWGPAEALFHYRTPPPYFGAAPESAAAASDALVYTLFHWGVSAWSAYAALGVPIAYYVFQRGAPLRVSTVLAPILGVDGLASPWSRLVDTLAAFAVVGGIATSVALVSDQFLAGVAFQWGLDVGAGATLVFVGGLTLIFVLSAATGIHRGVRRIAGVNVVLFGLFGLLLALVGPTGAVLDRGTAALGRYAVQFVPMSIHVGGEWAVDWTIWNWSWWFSWAPFAGLFVAALSRGRRIRTVVFTTVVATAAATATWFLLFGSVALELQQSGAAAALGAIAARGGSEAVAGFPLLAALPLGDLLVFLFLALIVAFMTTSADTSTLVVAILSVDRGETPSTAAVVFWGLFQGAVAVGVLLVGGAETLQALAVLTGGPFAVIAIVAIAGLTVALWRDERGHTSIVRRALERLPSIRTHHDVDPPEE